MTPEIAFNTGWLWGYLSKRGLDVDVVVDDDGNYQPLLDIKVPLVDPLAEGETKTIRVEVVEVDA